jgi:hypothetical protein
MQNKPQIILVLVLIFLSFGINYVSASDLNFTDDTNIALDMGTFVIKAGSVATSINVGGTDNNTLSITVPASSTLTLVSPDRYVLANDQNLTQNCNSTENSVVVGGGMTVTFTPNAIVCTSSNTGAGITSGVGTITGSSRKIIKSTPSVSTSGQKIKHKTHYDFGTAVLKNGSKGNAVKELQRFLNDTMKLGLIIDGKFGPKTTVIVKKWQKAHGLVPDGLIGAKTKTMMNAEVK